MNNVELAAIGEIDCFQIYCSRNVQRTAVEVGRCERCITGRDFQLAAVDGCCSESCRSGDFQYPVVDGCCAEIVVLASKDLSCFAFFGNASTAVQCNVSVINERFISVRHAHADDQMPIVFGHDQSGVFAVDVSGNAADVHCSVPEVNRSVRTNVEGCLVVR